MARGRENPLAKCPRGPHILHQEHPRLSFLNNLISIYTSSMISIFMRYILLTFLSIS
ncbi:hypothetical protein AFE_2042 [Acidithiobacillus ferrooxidans ATCC 23270]|uniref:Uncharacterized protein n=1 Tax=Acidithiobacillus ferrooxidans (strain ATCC 23270 / DSM 14882 / CIP 104768 / NCIMB 8455) TaxID=243159 RepID=B7J4Q3_ACIF2|nr:hypothetical protein AFE_2042 [Acidithiobacillus ferrooxidans ATCC 23270]